MEVNRYGLAAIILLVFLFFIGTVFMSLAWMGASDDAEEWKKKAVDRKESVDSLKQKKTSLESNVSSLRNRVDSLSLSNQELEEEVNSGMVFTSTPSWYETRDGDISVSFTVYNFGRETAKEVTAKFYVFDTEDMQESKTSRLLDVGNVAENSFKSVDYEFDPNFQPDSGDRGVVKIERCTDCIVLWDRIPGLDDTLEDSSDSETGSAA